MCWQFLLQSDMFMSVFPVPSPTQSNWISVWRSVSCSICSVRFFPLKGCAALGISWHNTCIWVFDSVSLRFVSWKGGWPGPGTGTGQGSSNLWEYFLCQCRTLYWSSLVYLFLLLFILVGWNHFHCLKLMLAGNSLWAFEIFFKMTKKARRKFSQTDKAVWKTSPLIWTPNTV